MAFKDTDRDLGNHVAFTVNGKGTGRRGVPTAIAELSKTETAAPVAAPKKLTTTGTATSELRNRRTIRAKYRFELEPMNRRKKLVFSTFR